MASWGVSDGRVSFTQSTGRVRRVGVPGDRALHVPCDLPKSFGGVTESRADIEAAIREILKELFTDRDFAELSSDADLTETGQLESVDTIEFVLEVERRFNVRIPDEDLERLTTIASVADYIVAQRIGA